MQNNDEAQETLSDVEYALFVLSEMEDLDVPVNSCFITLNAAKVRSCFELMLSLLEVHEGMQIPAFEDVAGFTAALH